MRGRMKERASVPKRGIGGGTTKSVHNKHMKVWRKRRKQGGLRINLLMQQVCHAVSLLGGPFSEPRGGENVNLGAFPANYALSLG